MIFNPRIQKSAGPVGTQISTLEVGTLVKINENGAPVEYLIVNQGLPSSIYDASCDGCWVLRKDIAENRAWDSSNDDYKNSDIQAYLNGSWLSRYSAGVLSQIKQVKIPYVNGTGGSPVASGATGLSCKIFLLSGYEVGFSTSDSSYFPRDGAKLSYFSSGTGSAAITSASPIITTAPPTGGSAPRTTPAAPTPSGPSTPMVTTKAGTTTTFVGFGPLWFCPAPPL